MGQCYGKTIPTTGEIENECTTTTITTTTTTTNDDDLLPLPLPSGSVKNTPSRSSTSPWPSPYPFGSTTPASGVSPSPARSTPRRFFKRPFPPPSPAKHIRASLRKLGKKRTPTIPEHDDDHRDQQHLDQQQQQPLDKNFGYNSNFGAKYEIGNEVGRGHFGHTCSAKGRKPNLRDLPLAVKIINKAKVPFPTLLLPNSSLLFFFPYAQFT